jgi:anti-sigma regulatory factor (Ser/Thr protein kinase)
MAIGTPTRWAGGGSPGSRARAAAPSWLNHGWLRIRQDWPFGAEGNIPVNVFEEGIHIGTRAGVMERQARGGGPTATGAFSSGTGEDSADGSAQGPSATQLSRRLGRSDLGAVPETRKALRELLRHWGRPGRSEVAELLTSELVTNALVHTDRDAVLTATVGPRGLRVEVRDFVARVPRLYLPGCEPSGDGTHGRGLLLVQSLADAWGVRTHGVGKAVWFELDAGTA